MKTERVLRMYLFYKVDSYLRKYFLLLFIMYIFYIMNDAW